MASGFPVSGSAYAASQTPDHAGCGGPTKGDPQTRRARADAAAPYRVGIRGGRVGSESSDDAAGSGNCVAQRCCAVGDALGIEIRPPLRSENLDRVKDPLEAITRASRVRHRRVLLRGAWWKSDCGPLVGYLKEKHSPVALLRARGSGYEIVDPETRQKVPGE